MTRASRIQYIYGHCLRTRCPRGPATDAPATGASWSLLRRVGCPLHPSRVLLLCFAHVANRDTGYISDSHSVRIHIRTYSRPRAYDRVTRCVSLALRLRRVVHTQISFPYISARVPFPSYISAPFFYILNFTQLSILKLYICIIWARGGITYPPVTTQHSRTKHRMNSRRGAAVFSHNARVRARAILPLREGEGLGYPLVAAPRTVIIAAISKGHSCDSPSTITRMNISDYSVRGGYINY